MDLIHNMINSFIVIKEERKSYNGFKNSSFPEDIKDFYHHTFLDDVKFILDSIKKSL